MPERKRRPQLDLTDHLERIMHDLCARIPEFAHINPRRVLIFLTRARGNGMNGLYAKIVPMRFPNGTPFKLISGHQFSLPQIPTPHGDVLYLIYIYYPRFFAQPFERRLLTLVHELYHIAPAFDGTIRRIGARAHGPSRNSFNDNLQPLLTAYLKTEPSPDLLRVLRDDTNTLSREATLVGRTLPVPKAIRLE